MQRTQGFTVIACLRRPLSLAVGEPYAADWQPVTPLTSNSHISTPTNLLCNT